jgi:hypothetical protein
MSSRSTDIIFLLGAGASVDARIPMSGAMVQKIESLLATRDDWRPYEQLYHHVKSGIYYAAGIRGKFDKAVAYNIETLVSTLYELERNELHPLYPFIASWNTRFVGLAREGFENVREFRKLILKELKRWMCPENSASSRYFAGFAQLQRDLNYPLNVFTLNYDQCFERLSSTDFVIETGFDDYGPNHIWNWERFESIDGGPRNLPHAYLYKLHGSVNWKRDEGKNLYCVEQTENVEFDRMEIIFGRDFKLEAADPYLFYAYQFRRCTLKAKLIVTIGYSFADSHINKMIEQALLRDDSKRVLVISACQSETEKNKKIMETSQMLGCKEEQILSMIGTAKSFLESSGLASQLNEMIVRPADEPF